MCTIAHIGFAVTNSDRSKEFYCQVLGCTYESSFQNEALKIHFLKAGNNIIELVQYLQSNDTPKTGVINHLAFEVDNLDNALEGLKKQNVALLSEPKVALGGKLRNVFFSGPDGERLEFVQYL